MRPAASFIALRRLAVSLFLVAAVFPCSAQEPDSTQTQSTANGDGSAFKLVTQVFKINKVQGRQITTVHFSPAAGLPMQAIGEIVQPAGDNNRAMVFVTDWDKDGMHEIQTVDTCGAGPNCAGAIYRIDARQGRVSEFFKTSGADISLMHGYLIEKSRGSCCAWVVDAYKLRPGGVGVEPGPAFSVLVEHATDKHTKQPVTCVFSQNKPNGRRVMAPPAIEFLSLCELYGKRYQLKRPMPVK